MGFFLQCSCFFLLFSLEIVFACLDGECRVLIFPGFSFFADKRLVNHTIRTERVPDMDVCELLCYNEPNCVSVNYETETNNCDLNNSTHQAHDEQFVDKKGYLYHGADSACDKPRCQNNGTCQSGFTDKKYRCVCPSGFTGEHCQNDINECREKTYKCGENAKCRNNKGSYTCICKTGYSGDGQECSDINECETATHNCSSDAVCNNTKGSYNCTCKPGYLGDGRNCTDINECAAATHNCSFDAVCNNTKGSFNCTCKPGYRGDGRNCTDINECAAATHNCSFDAVCNNTKGSFNCTCKPGYKGDGRNCTDINECKTATHNCSSDAVCNNTKGSYNCTCKPGYSGDGRNCTAIIAGSCDALLKRDATSANGCHSITVNDKAIEVYCHMTNGEGWTLIARFSNKDDKTWMRNHGNWWYDKKKNGERTDPSKNEDMIPEAFWLVRGNEFMITRSDDTHIALLKTTGDCLEGNTFKSKVTSYGNFKNSKVWASNTCLGNCIVQYGGKYQETEGFKQANCSDNDMQSAKNIGFWCGWENGGAVMMIGGGGAKCSGADHGIGVTKANKASFKDHSNKKMENDFGDNATTVTESYSLNLWVR